MVHVCRVYVWLSQGRRVGLHAGIARRWLNVYIRDRRLGGICVCMYIQGRMGMAKSLERLWRGGEAGEGGLRAARVVGTLLSHLHCGIPERPGYAKEKGREIKSWLR